MKTASLFLESEQANLPIMFEIRRIAKDFVAKGSVDIFANLKVKELLKELIENKFTVHMEVLAQHHLAIFYPLPYFRTEPANCVF
jgi:hypothetical protein